MVEKICSQEIRCCFRRQRKKRGCICWKVLTDRYQWDGKKFCHSCASSLKCEKTGPNAGLGIPYSPVLLIKAEGLLLKDAERLKDSKPYRFDIVDVQRQLMSNLGQAIHKEAATAFRQKDREAFALHSGRFLQLMKDVDELLRTRSEFNFDKWLSDARSWGKTEEEKDLLERDATALVTIWGADGDPLIFDYSWREWCGLISDYYLQRWQKFYAMLQEHLNAGTDYSEEGLKLTHGRESFRANAFYNELGNWELEFVQKSSSHTCTFDRRG